MMEVLKIILITCLAMEILSNATCQVPVQQKEVPIDTSQFILTGLPRPNSGTFTYEEAAQRKHEIYDMAVSAKFYGWENPTTGGAIHITANDDIEIYQSTIKFIHVATDVSEQGSTLAFAIPASRDTSVIVKQNEIKNYVSGMGCGNPASVLITSEINPESSLAIKFILDEIYEPATQIYYLKSKTQ